MKRRKSAQAPDAAWRPTRADLEAARTKTVRDIIGHGLDVLFVGINPGLYTAAIGHHFGRPGNRFWPALHAGGFTPRVLSPFEELQLLDRRLGITNFVNRATARADELTRLELEQGAKRLERDGAALSPAVCRLSGLDLVPRCVLSTAPSWAGSRNSGPARSAGCCRIPAG